MFLLLPFHEWLLLLNYVNTECSLSQCMLYRPRNTKGYLGLLPWGVCKGSRSVTQAGIHLLRRVLKDFLGVGIEGWDKDVATTGVQFTGGSWNYGMTSRGTVLEYSNRKHSEMLNLIMSFITFHTVVITSLHFYRYIT